QVVDLEDNTIHGIPESGIAVRLRRMVKSIQSIQTPTLRVKSQIAAFYISVHQEVTSIVIGVEHSAHDTIHDNLSVFCCLDGSSGITGIGGLHIQKILTTCSKKKHGGKYCNYFIISHFHFKNHLWLETKFNSESVSFSKRRFPSSCSIMVYFRVCYFVFGKSEQVCTVEVYSCRIDMYRL